MMNAEMNTTMPGFKLCARSPLPAACGQLAHPYNILLNVAYKKCIMQFLATKELILFRIQVVNYLIID
jgi:hypothetical protein